MKFCIHSPALTKMKLREAWLPIKGFPVAAILAALVFTSGATPYVLKERHDTPSGWKPLRRADKEHQIQLQIGLVQGRMSELLQHLDESKVTKRTKRSD